MKIIFLTLFNFRPFLSLEIVFDSGNPEMLQISWILLKTSSHVTFFTVYSLNRKYLFIKVVVAYWDGFIDAR